MASMLLSTRKWGRGRFPVKMAPDILRICSTRVGEEKSSLWKEKGNCLPGKQKKGAAAQNTNSQYLQGKGLREEAEGSKSDEGLSSHQLRVMERVIIVSSRHTVMGVSTKTPFKSHLAV